MDLQGLKMQRNCLPVPAGCRSADDRMVI
jgi:hypothetical protein